MSGNRLVGYCGWLPTTTAIAEAWMANKGPLWPVSKGMINAQSAMIAYLNDFKLMFWITLAAAPLLVFLRYRPQAAPAAAPVAAMAD